MLPEPRSDSESSVDRRVHKAVAAVRYLRNIGGLLIEAGLPT
jgi:hypothetical protein